MVSFTRSLLGQTKRGRNYLFQSTDKACDVVRQVLEPHRLLGLSQQDIYKKIHEQLPNERVLHERPNRHRGTVQPPHEGHPIQSLT
jgi:hypothetical protein